jgi:threonine/homoserine/homoserine lactone efflux protein
MSSQAAEFLTLMAVFGLAAVTPGPDFAMVVRQSVAQGRRAGILTSLGVGSAILFHAAYTIAGIGLVVAHSLLAFNVLKWAGAAYLVYVGIRTWRAPALDLDGLTRAAPRPSMRGDLGSFSLGFLTNALNPKAVLFFLSIFTTLVSVETPSAVQFGYGAAMAGLLATWFSLVAVGFTGGTARAVLGRMGRTFNRLTGGALVLLGVRLALQKGHIAA